MLNTLRGMIVVISFISKERRGDMTGKVLDVDGTMIRLQIGKMDYLGKHTKQEWADSFEPDPGGTVLWVNTQAVETISEIGKPRR